MFKLGFNRNDLKQLGMALVAMVLVIFLANESGLKAYLLTTLPRPEWLNGQGTLDIIFATIGIIIKKFFARNEPLYQPK